MSIKVTAIDQLTYDATLVVLRHHFEDLNVRWVHWTLRHCTPFDSGCKFPVIAAHYYEFDGLIEVPQLRATFPTHLRCLVWEEEDGTRRIGYVRATSAFYDKKGVPWDTSQGYMEYYFNEMNRNGWPEDKFPKFLSKQFILLPLQKSSEGHETL